ncbi:hypothetical protein C8R46DRAFT_1345225 [Mycena filopes]|nr:hypothetical protein C8R46DRAFT_1345225 [Mycena filopes]
MRKPLALSRRRTLRGRHPSLRRRCTLVHTPVYAKPFPGSTDVSLSLNIDIARNFTTNCKSTINALHVFLPSLLQRHLSSSKFSAVFKLLTLPPDKIIEISIPGGSPGAPASPFHLHGHNPHVIRSAGNDSYNFEVDPIIRDVVSTTLTGWHLEIGLVVIFAEDTGTLRREKIPAVWDKLCPTYDALKPDQL